MKAAHTIATSEPKAEKPKAQVEAVAEQQASLPSTPVLAFELGSLQVYSYATVDEATMGLKNPNAGYYWRDAGSPQGYGPFTSVYATVEHYKHVISMCKGDSSSYTAIGPKPAQVIRMDFQARRRVDS